MTNAQKAFVLIPLIFAGIVSQAAPTESPDTEAQASQTEPCESTAEELKEGTGKFQSGTNMPLCREDEEGEDD